MLYISGARTIETQMFKNGIIRCSIYTTDMCKIVNMQLIIVNLHNFI